MFEKSRSLLNIIDNRIKKIINQEKFPYVYSAIVTKGGVHGDICEVYLAGYPETKFNFMNKCHESLSMNDSVYVSTIGKNLTTGVITQKFSQNYHGTKVLWSDANGIITDIDTTDVAKRPRFSSLEAITKPGLYYIRVLVNEVEYRTVPIGVFSPPVQGSSSSYICFSANDITGTPTRYSFHATIYSTDGGKTWILLGCERITHNSTGNVFTPLKMVEFGRIEI